MRHPTEGVLRRLLDEPVGVADGDRQHIAGCEVCLDALAQTRSDAAFVGQALAAEADPDLDAAWQRLTTAANAPAQQPTLSTPELAGPQSRRVSMLLRRPAAAALAVGLVLSGAGAAAANDWLQIFRTEKLAPVAFSTSDLLALPDLSAYGALVVAGEPDVREVADAAAAERESGLDLPTPASLPRGITGTPTYQVGGKVTATFTFSADRAAQAAKAAGKPLPLPPPGLDGSSVRLVAGPGVAQIWESSAGLPGLVVARAGAPMAFSSGVPFEVVRDYLLSLPGLPPEVAEQLRTFAADGSTLPLPVPADQVTSRSTDVNDVPATVLATRDRSFAAVVWVDDAVVTVVAGSLDDDEVLSVARRLR